MERKWWTIDMAKFLLHWPNVFDVRSSCLHQKFMALDKESEGFTHNTDIQGVKKNRTVNWKKALVKDSMVIYSCMNLIDEFTLSPFQCWMSGVHMKDRTIESVCYILSDLLTTSPEILIKSSFSATLLTFPIRIGMSNKESVPVWWQ